MSEARVVYENAAPEDSSYVDFEVNIPASDPPQPEDSTYVDFEVETPASDPPQPAANKSYNKWGIKIGMVLQLILFIVAAVALAVAVIALVQVLDLESNFISSQKPQTSPKTPLATTTSNPTTNAASYAMITTPALTMTTTSLMKSCEDSPGRSGVYEIQPFDDEPAFSVFCTEDKSLVMQRRVDDSTDFYRNWTEYKRGFGDLSGNYWMGLETLHRLTNSSSYELRVDLKDWDNATRYAKYSVFSITSEEDNYRLHISGYEGDAGDSMAHHHNNAFSTWDRDNDRWAGSCAVRLHGAWWYNYCYHSKLNGKYYNPPNATYVSGQTGIAWNHWRGSHYSMQTVIMSIKKV